MSRVVDPGVFEGQIRGFLLSDPDPTTRLLSREYINYVDLYIERIFFIVIRLDVDPGQLQPDPQPCIYLTGSLVLGAFLTGYF